MVAPDGSRHEILPEHTKIAESKGYKHESSEATVIDKTTGLPFTVSRESMDSQVGVRDESPDEFRAREAEARLQREHGGAGERVIGGIESFAGSASFGGTDFVMGALGGEEYEENRRGRREASPLQTTITDIAGVVVPTLLTGGAGSAGAIARMTPAGLAERAGQAIMRGGAEKSLAKQFTSRALGYGVEGTLIGAGEGVQQLALSEDPITLERAVGVISSKALYGGGIGAGFGLAGKALEKGLGRAKSMLDDATSKLQSRGGAASDLAGLDKAALREAKRSAAGELGEEVVAGARAIDGTSDLFHVTASADKKVLADSRKWITKHLDDPKGLAENPGLVAKSLRKEEEILRKTIDNADVQLSKFAKADDDLLAKLSKDIDELAEAGTVTLKGDAGALYGNLNGVKVTRKRGVTLDKGDLEEFRALVQSGAGHKLRSEAIGRLPQALDENLALQSKIAGIKNGTAPRLAEIQAAQDAFSSGSKKAGMLEQAAQGSIFGAVTGASSFAGPLAPILGAKVSGAITDVIFGRISKAGADASIRSAKALEAFLDASKKASRVAPPLASKTLSTVAFGPGPKVASDADKGLVGGYKAREKELRAITHRGMDGQMQMTPEARQRVADQHIAVRGVDPLAADMMETTAARRVSFLASKLPRRPDIPSLQLGPDNWRPSDMAIRQFARFVAAVEDPGSIEERLADGSVTPEDAEAIRTVYPEMFEDIKNRIIESLPELKENLPYKRRLALSIFSGVAVDPAMDPRILSVLQGSFANEEGSEGGTQAPKAQAQFGSISKPNPTAAQERAG